MAKLEFIGHATFLLVTDEGTRIVIDPFLADNPATDATVESLGAVDYICLTHGHADHFADAVPLAKATGATLIATYEIVTYVQSQGIEKAHPMHIGGGWDFPFGRLKMTSALHGGAVEAPGAAAFTTVAAGLLFNLKGGQRVYFAGDTALTMDMQLLRGGVDVAVLPIGDNFTMGPEDAARAVEFIESSVAIPFHYGTWPYIEVDPQRFVSAVGDRARVVVLEAGESYDL